MNFSARRAAASTRSRPNFLVSFKTPKHVLLVDTIGRAANGKADYAGMARRARELLAGG